MKKIFLMSMLALVAAACSDFPMAPDAGEPLFAKGGVSANGGHTSSSEQVTVLVSAEYTTGGGIITNDFGVNVEDGVIVKTGHGWCGPDPHPDFPGEGGGAAGQWFNPSNKKWVPVVPHTHCILPGVTLVISFEELATYVLPNNGNILLNFADLDDDERKIHYRSNQDDTKGDGVLFGSDDQGGEWTLDLSQIDDSGNTIDRTGMELEVCNAVLGVCVTGTMTW